MTSRFGLRGALLRLVDLQFRFPQWFLLAALLTLGPCVFVISKLKIRTAFSELLPDDKPSVVELRRVNQRLPAASTLTVVAESADTALLKRFVDELTPKLRALPKGWVAAVDPGPREAQRFFESNKLLYLPLAEVERLHADVVEKYDREVQRRAGMSLDLEDDEDPSNGKPLVDSQELKRRVEAGFAKLLKAAPGQDGYYIGEDGKLAAIFVRTTLTSGDTKAFELTERIAKLIEASHYERVDPNFRYAFTGNIITSAEQYRAITADLVSIGLSGVALVLLVVFLFFLRKRALFALGVSIVVGCAWTLSFAWLSVGHLNTATGFLVSIVAGNGINAMVIWMARYLEARRVQGEPPHAALQTATLDTYEATLAVAAVSMVSYGALMTTGFRGFRDFGIIGGAGMLLCWVAAYGVLPAVLVLSERLSPLDVRARLSDKLAGMYGRPFAWLAKRHSGPVALVGGLLGAAAALGSLLYFLRDPMEYNLNNVLNRETTPTSAGRLSTRVNRVAGRINQGGRALLVDRLEQVEPTVRELERRRESAPEGKKPFGEVVSIFSLLPKDQPRKIELLEEVLDRVQRARQRRIINDEQWRELEPHLPEGLKPIGVADLPDNVARPFEEKDGQRGKIVYVAPTSGRSLNDAHYLMEWANSFRTVTLPNGEVIRGSGDAVVFSDMLINIREDAPRVAFTSLAGTIVVMLLAFRGRRAGFISLLTLLLGIFWMLGTLYIADIRLNFLNFVALPIAIGAGADYAINIMKRREIEGAEGVERAFIETGGAVVACSMTTLCGYSALLLSLNGAVRSFGLAAALGEVATQLAAMVVLPAVLFWHSRRTAVARSGAGAPMNAAGLASAAPASSDVLDDE